MYLNLLNKDEQQNFLELARYSMGVNGEHKKEEEEVLLGYKFECQLVEYKANRQDEIEKIITILGASTKKVRKIILIEILGLLIFSLLILFNIISSNLASTLKNLLCS